MSWYEITDLSRHLMGYFGEVCLAHAAVLVVFGLTLGVLRRRNANERYLVGFCCLVAMTVAAGWSLVFDRLAVPVLPPDSVAPPPSAERAPAALGVAGALAIEPVAGADEHAASESSSPLVAAKTTVQTPESSPWDALLVIGAGVYLLAAALLLVHLTLALALVAVRLRRAEPVTDRVALRLIAELVGRVCPQTNVQVVLSRDTSAPVTLGWLRHWILLPEEVSAGLSHEDRSRVLMHELAHVQRNDFAANLWQQVFKRVFWFNPLIWLFDRQLRLDREKACDDAVLSAMPDARAYAHCLTSLLSQQHARALNVVVTAGVLGFASNLHSRVVSILERRRGMSGKVSRLNRTVIWLAAVGLGMSLGGLSIGRRDGGPSVVLAQDQGGPVAISDSQSWSLNECVGRALKNSAALARLRIKVRAATAPVDKLQMEQLRLIHAVETAYWRYALAAERDRLARELTKSAAEVVKAAEVKVRAGVVPEMELLDCTARAARLELARVEATGEAEKLGTRLFALVTRKLPSGTERVAPTTKPTLRKDLPGTGECTAKAEAQRPDLLRAGVTVKTGRITPAMYATMRAEMATDVDLACRAIRNTAAEVAAAETVVRLARRRTVAVQKRVSVGKVPSSEIIAAQEGVLEAEASRFRALVRHEMAWSDLHRATGEGLERYEHLPAAATLSREQVTKALAKHTALPDMERDFVQGEGEPYLDIVEVRLAMI